jgi:hypothetical protein
MAEMLQVILRTYSLAKLHPMMEPPGTAGMQYGHRGPPTPRAPGTTLFVQVKTTTPTAFSPFIARATGEPTML